MVYFIPVEIQDTSNPFNQLCTRWTQAKYAGHPPGAFFFEIRVTRRPIMKPVSPHSMSPVSNLPAEVFVLELRQLFKLSGKAGPLNQCCHFTSTGTNIPA
jgi:hypothetical protein